MQEKKIIVAVVSHKKYPMPKEKCYLPIEVGAASRSEHFYPVRDDIGENISSKNKNYCELTGIYYAYKNLDYDILGLVHYRRYFMKRNHFVSKKIDNVLPGEKIEKLLEDVDFILPKKRHYYIETNYSHYVNAHKAEPLDKTREIIKEDYPEYLPYFDSYMKERKGHYFNMFIGNKNVVNGYLDWLFDILFKLEKQIDISNYSVYDQRVYGFVSERLLDVYIRKNNLTYKEVKYCFMEKQNWFKKIYKFLKRHFQSGKKEEKDE